jgi:deferrochelatase/peroxidase EfeB
MAIISNPVSIELDDIQSLLIRGFGQLPVCTYILLEIEKPALAREWLTELLPFLSPATRFEPLTGLNIAFTHPGLAALGLAEENLRNFPIPFREGISASHRSRILGDYGASAPSQWRWGGEGRQPHCLLVLFARDEEVMARFQADHLARVTKAGGLRVVHQLDGYRRSDGKEQFGFHDSISQPVIKGSGRSGPDNDLIAPGEFVLGYLNEHAEYPFSPLIARAQGDLNLLPPDAAGSGLKDLGRNGTFLVYRQIQQHVDRFWAFMEEKTRKPDGQTDPEAQVRLAAKMVGRWPGGASLVKFPDGDPGIFMSDNDFGYAHDDPFGYRCPYGSHLRRNNPRDNFRDLAPKPSLKITRRHRILRRGRLYDLPTPEGETEKGLHFLGFNADFEQQFEFIQKTWANDDQPKWLNADPDPLIGVPDPAAPDYKPARFTIQAEPVSRCVTGLQRFVTVRAGDYFFFPGLGACRYLASL